MDDDDLVEGARVGDDACSEQPDGVQSRDQDLLLAVSYVVFVNEGIIGG